GWVRSSACRAGAVITSTGACGAAVPTAKGHTASGPWIANCAAPTWVTRPLSFESRAAARSTPDSAGAAFPLFPGADVFWLADGRTVVLIAPQCSRGGRHPYPVACGLPVPWGFGGLPPLAWHGVGC